MTPRTLIVIHTLAVAALTGAAGYLTGAFVTGLPTTKAAWLGVLTGTAAAAISRLFGALLNLVQEKSGG